MISTSVMTPIVFCASPVPWASESIDADTICPFLYPASTDFFRARRVIR